MEKFILIQRPGIEPTPVARPMWLKKGLATGRLEPATFRTAGGVASHYATDFTNTSYEISL